MKNNSKKLTIVLLAAVMALGVLAVMPADETEAAGEVCEIDGVQYATLDAALAAVPTGGAAPTVIKLLYEIDYTAGLTINNKKITFDLDGFTLNIINPFTGGIGLTLTNGAEVDYIDAPGTGEFNITGADGLAAGGNCIVKVSNITANSTSSANGNGVRSTDGSNPTAITVTGKITASKYGISVSSGNTTVTVEGNITVSGPHASAGVAVYSNNVAVTVKGNITVSSTGTGDVDGVYTATTINAEVTVDGIITIPAGKTYIRNGTLNKAPADFTTPTTKTGYYTYTNGTGAVWVKIGAPYINSADNYGSVSGIGSTYAMKAMGVTPITWGLSGAPAGVSVNAATGVLMTAPATAAGVYSFTVNTSNSISSASQAFTLTVGTAVCRIGPVSYSTLDSALSAVPTGGASATTIELLVNINYNKGLTINNKKITFDLNGFTLNIINPATSGHGLTLTSGAEVDYDDARGTGALNVTGASGVVAGGYCIVKVSNITTNSTSSSYGDGVNTTDDNNPTTVTVTDDITATYRGVNNLSRYTTVNVGGDITVSGPDASAGVNTNRDDINVTVNGDIKVSGMYANRGINTIGDNVAVTVNGDIEVAYTGGTAAVYGIYCSSNNGTIVGVGGNVTISGTSTGNVCGAYTATTTTNVEVTIDGIITIPAGKTYVFLATAKTLADFTAPTTKTGYYTYTNGTCTVWVKIGVTQIISADNFGSVSGIGGTFAMEATGATPITWALYGEPAGVSVNAATGVLTIAPTTAVGVHRFTVGISNGIPSYASQDFTLTVGAAVCRIGPVHYSTLDSALSAVPAGGASATTIELLDDINYNKGLTINNKKITFDLNGFVLNINNTATSGYGLELANGAEVDYLDTPGTGAFNVTGASGVVAGGNCLVEVSNITANSTSSAYGDGVNTADDNNPTAVTVTGDITATYRGIYINSDNATVTVGGDIMVSSPFGSVGISVNSNNVAVTVDGDITVTVTGSGTGNSYGVACSFSTNTVVVVGGNVTVSSTSTGNVYGAYNSTNAEVTIDGIITIPAGKTYILAGTIKTPADYTAPTTKTGYYTYTEGTGTVWVKSGAPFIISADNFGTVLGAGGTFAMEATGVTPITWALIGEPAGVSVNAATGVLTIAPATAAGVYSFTVNTSNSISSASQAFTLTVGTAVCRIGPVSYSTLDLALATVSMGGASATTIELLADIDYSTKLTFDNKKITFDLNGFVLNINNTATSGYGLELANGAEVDYIDTLGTGAFNITGASGARTGADCNLTVTNITANGTSSINGGTGLFVDSNTPGGTVITVNGDISATFRGVYTNGNASVNVKGNIMVGSTFAYYGVEVTGSTLNVDGNITVANTGASGIGASGIYAYYGTAKCYVGGNVTVSSTGAGEVYGVYAAYRDVECEVSGNVTVSSTGAGEVYGVFASGNAEVTLDGIITIPAGKTYIYAGTAKTPADFVTPTVKLGYLTYSSADGAVVFVKFITTGPPVIVSDRCSFTHGRNDTFTLTAMGSTPITWSLSGAPADVLLDGTAGVLTLPSSLSVGEYNFTITASNGIHPVATKAFTLTVNPAMYTITLNATANGGTVAQTSDKTGTDGRLASLPTPVKAGNYSFSGWFTAASGGTQIKAGAAGTVFTASTTIYAQWTYTGGSAGGGGGNNGGGTGTPPTITNPDTTSIEAGVGGTFTLTVAGNKQVTWTLKDAPEGVSITNGNILTIAPAIEAGTYIITIYAADGSDVTSQTFTLKVADEGGNGGGDGGGEGIDTWVLVLTVIVIVGLIAAVVWFLIKKK
jgi:hypothetical protein